MVFTLIFSACWGKSALDLTTPNAPPVEIVPVEPALCELPAARQVKAVLRLSNYEYRQLATDLLQAPVPDALFLRWNPVPAVFGYDTMSEARVDAQSLTEQLRTAEALTTSLLASPMVLSLCPAPTARPAAACTEKASYEPIADFSTNQNDACWSFADSTGAAMGYVAANGRWESADHSTLIWNTGMHPGNPLDAVRKWQAPQDGAITLAGEFKDVDPGGGDGVTAVIRKNGAELWRSVIANASGDTFDLRLTVKRGDTFEFGVNRTGDTAYDTTAFNASIGFTAAREAGGWTWDNCARPVVERTASRMLRRPLSEDELADYQALFNTATTDAIAADHPDVFWSALETVVQASLVAPSVLYKTELTGALPTTQRGYEVASRLSLFFCSSYPDDELWQLAGTGALSDPKVVAAQAGRLLDKCLARFSSNFAGQWLGYRARLDAAELDPLTTSMRAESAAIFAEVVASGGTSDTLLAPGYTLVDAPLATWYGLDFGAVDGAPIHRISTADRGGLFKQGHFLTSTARGSEFKRVIDRGIWTLNRVLCRQLPPLNAATREEIAASMMAIDPGLSLAERMKLHREKGTACISCHGQMDPIGLSLEKYDTHGQWRETYPDGSAITNDFKLDGRDVRDPNELASAVQSSADFRECVATQLITYGLNRPMNDEEKECTAMQLARPLDNTQPKLRELIIESALTSLRLTGGL